MINALVIARPGYRRDSLCAMLNASSPELALSMVVDSASLPAALDHYEPALAVWDPSLPFQEVLDSLQATKNRRSQTCCLVIVAKTRQRQLALSAGADAALERDLTFADLRRIIASLVGTNRGLVKSSNEPTLKGQNATTKEDTIE